MGKRNLDSCVCSGAGLAKLVRPSALAVLAAGPAHGYAILERLSAERAIRRPDHSALYRALRAMEDEGLVSARLEAGAGAPARREYRLTADGRACLRRWTESLAAYRGTLDAILRLARRAKPAL
jgi:DNA-binding PadR family transcriptional regulator